MPGPCRGSVAVVIALLLRRPILLIALRWSVLLAIALLRRGTVLPAITRRRAILLVIALLLRRPVLLFIPLLRRRAILLVIALRRRTGRRAVSIGLAAVATAVVTRRWSTGGRACQCEGQCGEGQRTNNRAADEPGAATVITTAAVKAAAPVKAAMPEETTMAPACVC